MLINNIELSEPEVLAKLKAMANEIVRLNEVIKRYEGENRQLTEKLDDIGEQYNAQVAVIGFLEEDNKRFDDDNKELKRLLKEAINDLIWLTRWHDPCELCAIRDENGDCPVCGSVDCDEVYKWRLQAEALKLIGGEEDG